MPGVLSTSESQKESAVSLEDGAKHLTEFEDFTERKTARYNQYGGECNNPYLLNWQAPR